MIPELAIAMMACAGLAPCTVLYSGVQCGIPVRQDRGCGVPHADHLRRSLQGGEGRAPEEQRGSGHRACQGPGVEVNRCFVVRRAGLDVAMKAGRDLWWHELMEKASKECKPEEMDAEDPLFILYTSVPRESQRCAPHTGGYMVYTAHSFKYIFDYQDETSSGARLTSDG